MSELQHAVAQVQIMKLRKVKNAKPKEESSFLSSQN